MWTTCNSAPVSLARPMATRAANIASSEPSVASRIFAGKSLILTSLSMPRCRISLIGLTVRKLSGTAPAHNLYSYLPRKRSKQARLRIKDLFHGVDRTRCATLVRGQRGGRGEQRGFSFSRARGGRESHPHENGPVAVGPLALAGDRGTRDHVDPRRA